MTKKTLEIKTTITSIILILILYLFVQPVAFAARSSAGGGKEAKFSVGKWAVGTGIGLASMGVGNAVSNAVFTDATLASNLKGLGTFSTWGNNYAIMAGTNQIGRAAGAMGTYYGWNPKSTIFVSSLASGMASGGINPSQFGAEGILTSTVSGIGNGIALGAINGSIEGGILSGLADKRGKLPIWAGPAAGLAGNFATGYVVNGFSNRLSTQQDNTGIVIDHTADAYKNYVKSGTYSLGPGPISQEYFDYRTQFITDTMGKQQKEWVPVQVNMPAAFSFKNKFYAKPTSIAFSSKGIPTHVISNSTFRNSFIGGVVKSIPASVLSFGVQSMVKDKDWQDAYIVRQAFTGAYPLVNYSTDEWLKKHNINGEARAINRDIIGTKY